MGVGGHMLAEKKNPGLVAQRKSLESIKKAKPWDKVLASLMAISIGFPMIIVAALGSKKGLLNMLFNELATLSD